VSGEVVSYEYMAPLLRIARSLSLEEDIRLAVSEATSPEKLLSALRGSRLGSLLPPTARGSRDVERAAWSYYAEILVKLRELGEIAPQVYAAYSMPLISRDLSIILGAAIEGEEPPREELSAPSHPLVAQAVKIGIEEGSMGLSRLFTARGLSLLGSYLRQVKPDKRIANMYLDLEVLRLFRDAYYLYRGEIGGEHLCYRLDLYAARASGNALLLANPEANKALERELETCLIDRDKLLEAVFEASLERLVPVLQTTPYIAGAASRMDLMELFCHMIRKYSRARIYRNIAYDPTSPGYSIPVLELLLLDVEDVVALSILSQIGGPRELVAHTLSIQL